MSFSSFEQTANEKQFSSGTASGDRNDSWTYLVNLTATMFPNNGAGAGYKYEKLKELKDLSKNSNSEIIVQEYDESSQQLKRYQIEHGRIHDFAPVKSAGSARDLQDLIAAAPRGGHIALINQAHGNGDKGFTGDFGDISVASFEESVKAGLASAGRDSLDLLSLDSCLMSNVHALSKLSGLARHIVASELEELSSVRFGEPLTTNYDMQPIDKYLSFMLEHNPKDGAEAAADMVAISKKDCDALAPEQDACGTPTLASLNPGRAEELRNSLNQFGAKLQATIEREPMADSLLDGLIGQMHDVSQVEDHLRDVHTFAEGVVKLVESGSLQDQDGELKKSAQAVLAANDQVIVSFYTNPRTRLQQALGLEGKLHGVNVFLPGADYNIRAQAVDIVGAKAAENMPLNELLDKEIRSSIPDDENGGWAKFISALRKANKPMLVGLSLE